MRAVHRRPAGRDGAVLEQLARRLFGRALPEELERQPATAVAAMLRWLHDFYVERPAEEPKIRVLEPTAEREGWELPYAVVLVATDDRPFLVDSIGIALAECEVTVQAVYHPQIDVERDADGRLQALLDRATDNGGAIHESLMLFWVDRPLSEATSRGITERVQTALEDVESAVSDWQAMAQRTEDLIAALEDEKNILPEDERGEAQQFLRWMARNHFTFLGYREYEAVPVDGDRVLKLKPETGLGILRASRKRGRMRSIADLETRLREFSSGLVPLIFTKTDARSTVHRRGHMDYVGVLRHDAEGRIVGEARFVGLYTSSTYHRSTWEIPFIRRKADAVLIQSEMARDSHGGKALVNILESLPRDELFQSTTDELYRTAMGILELEERKRTRVFVRRDHVAQFFSCLVFIPRERFNTTARQRVQRILREALGGAREDFALQLGEADMVRVHFIVRPEGECSDHYDVDEIERRIVEAVRSWHDRLRDELIGRQGDREGLRLAKRFEGALPVAYVDEVAPDAAAFDIERMDALSAPDDIAMSLYRPRRHRPGVVRFKVFKHDHTIPLSEALPMLERMGLRPITERPYEVRLPEGEHIWIQDFDLVAAVTEELDLDQVREPFQQAFERVWRGEAESDGFNRLILLAQLDWRQAALMRAYCKYLLQTGVPFSQAYMEDTLARHPVIARLLVELFEARLDPAREDESRSRRNTAAGNLETSLRALLAAESSDAAEPAIETVVAGRRKVRTSQVEAVREVIEELLDAVASLDEDRILRGFASVIDATLRSNVFQRDADDRPREYMAFKFDSGQVPDLPRPRPLYETYVYSPRVEGIHLRGGKVARGGLRWSDRREDFRTEVLGLMKAQTVKNTLIVPVGAKGGFVSKRPPTGDRDAIQREGIACYRDFIHGLLDLADNYAGTEVEHPPEVVRYDAADPYLVVAADKGTATFSDIANEVAREHGFWLDDAFASGGSNGYDHKAMGITAKGAWESVKRHFRESGLDCQREPFTAVGIGDMGGDVFGNGMLLSPATRLVAAFNHLHIFIDPNPDVDASYAERQRLFAAGGGWDQYDKNLISRGGGVWSRTAKRIKLSQAARKALGIEAEELAPNELIRAILTAPVDLLWNGGIGTYVKGADERDEEVGDRANRTVRVNGGELRCRVVGEGGNLGFTQAGRIEYALAGGRINADFIDNSGGVDCSDREVNIKILLNDVVVAGELTTRQRNNLLARMGDEVAALVLRNNYLQSQAISLMSSFSVERLGTKAHVISHLESRGILDRQLERLPDEEQIAERRSNNTGLMRPELAVLLSYAKIALYPQLLDSDVPEDPYLARELIDYFPEPLQAKYEAHMRGHRLWREIIATQVTNAVVNRMGASFVLRMQEETSATPAEVARAFTAARAIFDAPALWQEIEALDGAVASAAQLELLRRVWEALRHVTRWLLNRPGHRFDIAADVEAFRPGVQALREQLDRMAVPGWQEEHEHLAAELVACGVPEALARRVAALDVLYPAPDIVAIANELRSKVEPVGAVYARIGEHFGLRWLRDQIDALPVDGMWQANARGSLRDELYEQHRALTLRVMHNQPRQDPDEAVRAWLGEYAEDARRVSVMLNEMQRLTRIDYATAVVAIRALEQLIGEVTTP
ncbi:MAG: NAD-glutamate dehydrogenase [Halofilum sp. (in: g-proteobacteria)]